MEIINRESAIRIVQEHLEKADQLFPDDLSKFDPVAALAWLLPVYPLFRHLIVNSRMFDYSVILSSIDRKLVSNQTKTQTELDLYSAAGQVTGLYKRFDQRERM